MKKNFVTGMILLLPVMTTCWVAFALLGVLTGPFQKGVVSLLNFYNIAPHGFLFWSSKQFIHRLSQMLVLVTMFLTTFSVGFLAKRFFLDSILAFGHGIILKIPFINKIYKTFFDMTHGFVNPSTSSFMKVVLVPFPQKNVKTLGFITSKNNDIQGHASMITVFIPGTPNPTAGFQVMFLQKEVEFLDMSVEDALKTIISIGMIFPPLKAGSPQDK